MTDDTSDGTKDADIYTRRVKVQGWLSQTDWNLSFLFQQTRQNGDFAQKPIYIQYNGFHERDGWIQ